MNKGEKITIDIICPLYNAEKYINSLNQSLRKQEKVNINNTYYILTESNDNTENILKENKINYAKITKEKFSHSLTREKQALKCSSDIIVFISQDVIIDDNLWLNKLTSPIVNNEAEATYSKQLTKYNNIEKYVREFNYPNKSIIKTKKDINKLGIKTFFFSDVASAVKKDIFIKLNGYDNKDLPTNEDMYFAHKLINNGYKIKYCSESYIYHSHKFTLKELYKRYKLTGMFFKENNYLYKYKATSSGSKMAKYIFKRLIQEHRFILLLRYPFDMAARLIGMKVGEK